MWSRFSSLFGALADWGLSSMINQVLMAAIATLFGIIAVLGTMLYFAKQNLHRCELKKASCLSALVGEESRVKYGDEMCSEVQNHCDKKIQIYKNRILELEKALSGDQ